MNVVIHPFFFKKDNINFEWSSNRVSFYLKTFRKGTISFVTLSIIIKGIKMPKQVRKNTSATKLREERKLIVGAAKKASSSAVRISTALELPIQMVKGNKVVLQEADGTTRELKEVRQVKSNVNLAKGVKICLQPKD